MPDSIDEVVPFPPVGTPPSLALGEKGPTLPERADEVERRLGMALKSYRQRAEEILEKHFEDMENTQIAHDHQVSMLKAENAKLREIIGKGGDPSFPQSIMFQTMKNPQDEAKSKKDLKNKARGHEDDDDKKALGTRKNKKNDGSPEQPGGSWQQFMAWVPNGAALLSPEPWKPLLDVPGSLSPMGEGGRSPGLKSQRSLLVTGASNYQNQLTNIIPGSVSEEKKRRGDDDEDDSEEDEESMKGKWQLLEVWKPTEKEKRSRRTVGQDADLQSRESGDIGDDYIDAKPRSKFILNPDSNVRIVWDMGSLFMVVYDMVMIPMAVFSMPASLFLQIMDWTTRLFWTFDMGWSCCTGVVLPDGSVEYDFRSILKRYLKSWFALDFFIVGSDWAGLILESGGMGLSRLARVSRVARVVRLLRLVRMQEVIASITERIQSDSTILLLQIFKLLVILIACCHAYACGWWGVGSASSRNSWIKQHGYDDEGVGLQYLVSLHWSLSQFSGGLEGLGPTTPAERVYTVFIWIASFISGLVMLSFLTSSLTQQYIIGGSGARQMATLKKYLQQNKIPKNLIKRLCRSAKHAIAGDLQPESVDLLHVVSDPLKVEMHYEMYMRVLSAHPFFIDFNAEANQVVRRVCHLSMSMLLVDAGDVVFRCGEEPAEGKMYFVFSGSFEYEDKYKELTQVTERMWLSEAALWTYWRHQGTLTATSDAKLAVLDAEGFQDVCEQFMRKSKGAGFNPKIYASAFTEELNNAQETSDLQALH